MCVVVVLLLTLLRRRSEASVLEDLEVLMPVGGAAEEEEEREGCLARSWSPGLGSPTLVVPPFNMAVGLLPAPKDRWRRRARKTDRNIILCEHFIITYDNSMGFTVSHNSAQLACNTAEVNQESATPVNRH